MSFSFTVNGKLANIDAAPDTPLLWVVREHLKLTGTKYGCGAGMCGACTVHLNGQAVRSCQTPIATVTGKIAPCVGNAVFRLTGRRLRALPFSPERIKKELPWR